MGRSNSTSQLLPSLASLLTSFLMVGRVLKKAEKVIVEDVFLVDKNGILIKHATRRIRPNIDNDLLAGMLTAVQMFIEDSFKYSDDVPSLKALEFGNKELLIERGEYSYLAIIYSGEFSKEKKEKIKQWLLDFEKQYSSSLKHWHGDMTEFENLEDELGLLFSSEPDNGGSGRQGISKSLGVFRSFGLGWKILGELIACKVIHGRFKIEELFLIHKIGFLIAHVTTNSTDRIEDVKKSGMLLAGMNLIRDSFAPDNGNTFTPKNLRVMGKNLIAEKGEQVYVLMVHTGGVKKRVLEEVKNVIESIEKEYGEALVDWQGDYQELEGIDRFLEGLL